MAKRKQAAKKATKKAVKKSVPAKKEGTSVMTPEKAALMMAQDSGQGSENVGAEDLAIPFIGILQSNSPQVVKGPDRIDGAEAGFFFNNVSMDVFDGDAGIDLIPCFFQKLYVEWVPRDAGGGFVMAHTDRSILDKCERNEKNRDVLPNKNEIVPTAYHYCLLVTDAGPVPVVIGMCSTQLKKSRRWNSTITARKILVKGRQITPPSFSHIYRATSIHESNNQGAWFGWNISPKEMITDASLYQAAKDFYEAARTGAARLGPPPEVSGHVETVPETEEF